MAVPFEERLRIVKLVSEEGKTKSFVAFTEGYSRASVHSWVSKYLEYGEAGLEKKKHPPKYSQQIKDAYLASVEVEGLTVNAASKKFNIPQQTFYEWRKERDEALPVEVKRIKKLNKEKKAREDLQNLRKENRRLKMENEILKKLQASTPKRKN